jgi:hypothetical protein
MAETFALTKGTEAGTRIRAAIVDAKGKLDIKSWEETAALEMGHMWFTDCDSLYEHLVSVKMNQIENKRLRIDMMSLRQQIWERGGERTETLDYMRGDYPRWIDTSTMIADPLTKVMNADRMTRTFETGIFDWCRLQSHLQSRNGIARPERASETQRVRSLSPSEV